MYLVAKGECVVNIKDANTKQVKGSRILTTSDYFGEISLIYGCRRTASVVSRKYTTLAKITRAKFKELTTEFPEIIDALK
jgi:CRP-like cAMP-binding protein